MPSPGPVLVELRRASVLWKRWKLPARVSLAIRHGEHAALVGDERSGKDLLARALLGEAVIVEGEWLLGTPARGRSAPLLARVSFEDDRDLASRHVHYLQGRYESLSGNGAPTVDAYLGTGEARPAILERLGLRAILRRPVSRLSNGEMRKLLLAEALLARPDLLVLEEPFQGLDLRARRALAGLLREAGRGTTFLVLAARREGVPAVVERVVAVEQGRIALDGPRRAVLGNIAAHRSLSSSRRSLRRAHPARGAVLARLVDVTVAAEGVRILDRVSWTVREGEHWAVVGPNGSGKTTLLSLILADHPQAYSNEVHLFGRRRGDGESIWEVKARLGHVSPEVQIHHRTGATVLEVVLSGFFDSVGLHRRATMEQTRRARVWLRAVGLSRCARTPYAALGEGERRLALLARALVKDPLLLVLDEPGQGLDEAQRRRLLGIVDRLAARRRPTILLATHDADEVSPRIARELRLDGGRVVRARRRG